MGAVPRGPKKRPPLKRSDMGKTMIDALTAAAFEDMPESLLPTPDDVGALLDALLLGAFDDHLEQIASVVKLRRDMIAGVTELIARGRFAEGDRVRFVEAARPRYLGGHTATVTKKEMEHLVVQLDEPMGRYTDGMVKTRATQLEALTPE